MSRRILIFASSLIAVAIAACDSDRAVTPPELGYRLTPAVPTATFPEMLGFAIVPGSEDEAIVITRGGRLWRVPLQGAGDAALFGDISDLLIRDPEQEEGLLGIAFSPNSETDSSIYLYYSAGPPRRTVLSRFRVTNGELDTPSEQVLLEVAQPFPSHKGGQLTFGPDGMLYLGLGDGGAATDGSVEGDPLGHGQDLSTLLGSILRLNVSNDGAPYGTPPDNPLVNTPGAASEIYAYGLRNPWRFSFDRHTGELWAGDVGGHRWEEVDRIVAGGNYGWNIMEGFECFASDQCDQAGLKLPRAVYSHEEDCAVVGGHVYRGHSMPELDGYFVYGDFCSGHIWAVDTSNDTSLPILLAATGSLISSFAELPDGELLVLVYTGSVLRLERAG